MSKKNNKTSFKWISAGSGYEHFGNTAIYVRFKKRKGPYKEKKTPSGCFFALIDRELFVTTALAKRNEVYTLVKGFDYCVNADLLGFGSMFKHSGIMWTYYPSEHKRSFSYDKRKATFPIFADCGGYPLKKGTLDFIYPDDLAIFYNKYATRGMAIDIPIEIGISNKLVRKLGKYQKKNTKNLMKDLNKDVKLYNISHGAGYEQRKMYMDIVDLPGLDYWAIGGARTVSIFDLVYNIFSVISYKKAKSYHVFGVAGFKGIPILAWIGKYFNLTSDSSSALQPGRSARMFFNVNDKVRPINVGHFMDDILHSNKIFSQLSCSCPICNALGTSEMFYKSKFHLVFVLCVLHNINFYTTYSSIWNNLAQECTADEYKKQVKKHIKQDTHLWSALIDYVEEIVSTSFEKANKKFSSYLTLFHKPDSFVIDDYALFEKEGGMEEVRLKHLMSNFKRYYAGEKPISMPKELKKSSYSFVKKMTRLSGLSKRKRFLG